MYGTEHYLTNKTLIVSSGSITLSVGIASTDKKAKVRTFFLPLHLRDFLCSLKTLQLRGGTVSVTAGAGYRGGGVDISAGLGSGTSGGGVTILGDSAVDIHTVSSESLKRTGDIAILTGEYYLFHVGHRFVVIDFSFPCISSTPGVSSAAGTGSVMIASGESLASEAGSVSVHAGAGATAGEINTINTMSSQ